MSTFLMVSGASRGLGRAIAVEFARSSLLPRQESMEAVLLARSMVGGLDETENAMHSVRGGSNNSNLTVHRYSVDLGKLDTLEHNVGQILDEHAHGQKLPPPSRAILVNCAGTTGWIGRNPTSLAEIQQATDLNFTSKAWLTAQFVDRFGKSDTTIVNVSSMCAVKPTPTMALYCATSAAREMFHTVLAMDAGAASTDATNNSKDTTLASSSTIPRIRILNYAPGSCDTNMQALLREHESLDPTVKAYCNSLVSHGLVHCQDTAKELVRRVLEPNAFQSGERVEFVNMSTYNY